MSAQDKRARRERLKKKQAPPSARARAIQIAIVLVGLVVLVGAVRTVWNNMIPPEPPRLTDAQTKALSDAVAKKGYDAPYSVVLDANQQLIVTFILDEPKSPTYLKGFALDRMATVREAFGKKSPAKSYRVNINASAMDPQMMIRWGHAIYDKGDSVHWEPGK
jgi:hypothetical protein